MPVSDESHSGPFSTRFLFGLTICLSLLLLLLLGPVRSHSLSYRVGPLAAGRIAITNLLKGPVRVGIQVGHLDSQLHPEEHADLRFNTGGHAAGIDEVDVNARVAAELQSLLLASGVQVDILPASVPVDYSADAFVSLHADSVLDEARSGYKSAYFEPLRNRIDPLLKQHIDAAWLPASGLRDDALNTSSGMFRYYAFNPAARHSVNPRTPALLVEMGYISNPADRRFLADPRLPAALLAEGILAFLTDMERLPPRAGDTGDARGRW